MSPNPVPGAFLCDANISSACWADYGVYGPAAYAKDAFGFVHLRGLVYCTEGGNTSCEIANIDNIVFVLASGYRPAEGACSPP